MDKKPFSLNTLSAKLLLAFGGLMVTGFILSGIVFELGTKHTSSDLLETQIHHDLTDMVNGLALRTESVQTSTLVLADNPIIANSLKAENAQNSSTTLDAINSQVVLVRERFGLDLVQIYNQEGLARSNIVQSSLYRVSSLIGRTGSRYDDVMQVGDRLIYLSSMPIKDNGGTVITGIDLEEEVKRLITSQHLSGDLEISLVSAEETADVSPWRFDASGGETYVGEMTSKLGDTVIQLRLTRAEPEIARVINAGRNAMLGSFALSALLLLLFTALLVQLITRPIREMVVWSNNLAAGDFENNKDHLITQPSARNPFRIGVDDEIGQLAEAFCHMEDELREIYSSLIQDLQQSYTELNQAYDETLRGWCAALELRDHETERHAFRVANMTVELATIMGLPAEEIIHIRRGALLHDIGKLAIPDNVLRKPGKLNDEEWSIMKQHPLFAYLMLRSIDYLKKAIEIPYAHHERWDGSGYPRGLKGEEIPISARLFMVVDVWDALQSDRYYRAAWPKEKTINYIRNNSGKLFDPQVVEVFLKWLAMKDSLVSTGIELAVPEG